MSCQRAGSSLGEHIRSRAGCKNVVKTKASKQREGGVVVKLPCQLVESLLARVILVGDFGNFSRPVAALCIAPGNWACACARRVGYSLSRQGAPVP